MIVIESGPLIVFLSDFGLSDPYVGIIKGVIFAINPSARVIDLTHTMAPQNFRQAAFILTYSFEMFPAGTIFLSVVDPSVGSKRAGLIIRCMDRFLVGPDNGTFGPIIKKNPHGTFIGIDPEHIIERSAKAGYRPGSSRTFHARDIFAPAAALLSLGTEVELLGQPHLKPASFSFPEPAIRGRTLKGRIIYFDHFGNAVTNIPSALLNQVSSGSDTTPILSLKGRGIEIPFLATYSMAQKGEPLFLINSFDLVEIAVNCGNAGKALGLNLDDRVTVG